MATLLFRKGTKVRVISDKTKFTGAVGVINSPITGDTLFDYYVDFPMQEVTTGADKIAFKQEELERA